MAAMGQKNHTRVCASGMNNVDPDILFALKSVAGDGESERLTKVTRKYKKQAEKHFETEMELLADEVARVVPRSHTLFDLVLILAVIRKVERKTEEPEFVSDLEAGWPQGW